MKENINVCSYDCYEKATEKQLKSLKWKEKRIYFISEILNDKLQDEIYAYINDRCKRLSITTVVNDIYRFELLKDFINEKCRNYNSITDKNWRELEKSYKVFLYKKGRDLYVRRNRADRNRVERQNSAQISYFKMYYKYAKEQRMAHIPENEKDVWDMRKLDIVPRCNPIRGKYRLDFREIKQSEFKEMIKKILYNHCLTKAMGSIKSELYTFRRFTSFLADRCPEVNYFIDINRNIIEEYLIYIKSETGLSSASYSREISVLSNLLFEIGRELEIENLCDLFLTSDCKLRNNALPNAYSDAEIKRFNSALTKIEPDIARCVIIHQMLGTRIEDTLTLRRDCLNKKAEKYFVTVVQQKTRKYTRPISDMLAKLIKRAIEVSEKKYPNSEYIFLQENGKLFTDAMLKYHVNVMIYRNNIRDDNGNYFKFRTHRFRHTFGVKLTEMKLDDDSIARLLGHKDTRTVQHYRKLRNEKLAEDTENVRNEMNQILKLYQEEKRNAEIR
jgi:integrase